MSGERKNSPVAIDGINDSENMTSPPDSKNNNTAATNCSQTKIDWRTFKREIIERLPIEAIYGNIQKLKPSGDGWLMGCCPFHDDEKASFAINKLSKRSHCKACGFKGSAFDYEIKRTGKAYKDVLFDWGSQIGIDRNGFAYKRAELDPLNELCFIRGWDIEGLKRLNAEAYNHRGVACVKIPMFLKDGKICGHLLRRGDNRKFLKPEPTHKSHTLKGDKRGLIYPKPFPQGYTLVCEGETDVIACLSAEHLAVVGTSSASLKAEERTALQRLIQGRRVILFPDPKDSGNRWLKIVGTIAKNIQCSVNYYPADSEKDLDDRLRHEVDKAAALRKLIHGAIPWEPNSGKLPKQGELLTRICEQNIEEYIHSTSGKFYVLVPSGKHKELWSTDSRQFKLWLAREYRDKFDSPPNNDALKQCQYQVESQCIQESKRKLHVRVASHDDALYYDLTNENWSGVKITANDWQDSPLPAIFKRYEHQLPQRVPVGSGNPKDILKFMNIDPDSECLFLCCLISNFIPDIPHPLMLFEGRQGSGKTNNCRIMKDITDPSEIKIMAMPKDLESAEQIFDHHWFVPLDNISRITEEFSNFFCRAVTGEGISKRSLYTNDDDFIRMFRRCIAINGIGVDPTQEDLLDRTIIINVPKLEKRRTERDIENEWSEKKPYILGGIFDTVVKAMKEITTINDTEFRMADFARWGIAISLALGYDPGQFEKSYRAATQNKWSDLIENSPLAQTLINFIAEQNGQWVGSPSEMFNSLPTKDKEGKPKKGMPQSARSFGKMFKRLIPALENLDYVVDFRRSNGKNNYYISQKQSGMETHPREKMDLLE